MSTVSNDRPNQLQVTRDDDAGRWEGRLQGQVVAVVDYRREGDTVVITHTGTEPGYRGRGLAGQITRAALDDLRADGLRVRPVCPYTAAYLEAHPADADLVVRSGSSGPGGHPQTGPA